MPRPCLVSRLSPGTSRAPSENGMSLEAVDTPALLIDLDAFERNLARMALAGEGSGARLRPHSKTHKSPVIALRQMALGAVGVCCQKVSEAEIMVLGGEIGRASCRERVCQYV